MSRATWRDRAIERSLADRQARSERRLNQFVDAARSLVAERDSPEFTVQELVEASGLSLKTFYRYFEGKDEIVLALIEDDVRVGSAALEAMVSRKKSPRERLRAFVLGAFSMLGADEDLQYASMLARQHLRLAEARPQQLDAALAPFVDLLGDEIGAAMRAGDVRRGDAARDAAFVFQVILGEMHGSVFGRRGGDLAEVADYTWQFVWCALRGTRESRIPRGSP